MKIGIKTFNNALFLESLKDKADFIEIMAVEGNNYDFLKKFSLPIIVHAQHENFGINNADKTTYLKNLNSINFARKIADLTNAKKIVLHPGPILNEMCSKQQAIQFVKEIKDKRVLIENLPAKKNICSTPNQVKGFLKQTNTSFCFDINHAIETASYLKQDYLEIIKEFIKLKPVHYHLGGQNISLMKTHLCFADSNIELEKIFKMIPKDAEITLETTTDIKKTEEDLKIIREIINNL